MYLVHMKGYSCVVKCTCRSQGSGLSASTLILSAVLPRLHSVSLAAAGRGGTFPTSQNCGWEAGKVLLLCWKGDAVEGQGLPVAVSVLLLAGQRQ